MLRSVLSRVFTAVMIVLALGLCGVGVLVGTNHMHLQPVLSGSMRPLIQPGDLAVTWSVPTTSLKVGDVITFFPPNHSGEAVIHRLQSLKHEGGKTVVTTKGDANNVADAWNASLQGSTAYRLALVIPKAGFIPVWTGQMGRSAAMIVLGVLVALIAAQELLRKPAAKSTDAAVPSDVVAQV